MAGQMKPGRVGPVPVTHSERVETEEYRAPINTLASKLALGEKSGVAQPNLLDALRRLREVQSVAKATPKPAEDVEAKALRKSRKRLRRHFAEGTSPARAVVLSHAKYRSAGGKSGIDVWSRKMAEGK